MSRKFVLLAGLLVLLAGCSNITSPQAGDDPPDCHGGVYTGYYGNFACTSPGSVWRGRQ